MKTSYNFDEVIDRRNTSCLKYDFAAERKGREDLLPLWVADMDFRLPQEVLDDLAAVVSHGIFGYTDPKDDYYEALLGWYQKQFGWKAEKDWVLITPGVVFAFSLAIQAYTEPGDSVLIQQPVYYPFAESIKNNGRKLVNNQLVYKDHKYSVDFEDFEQKIISENIKLFILCSPHNPVGRVWNKDELLRMGEICLRHGVLVVSDEIHSDFVYPGHTHHVFADLNEEFKNHSIICTAPSKTFNLAGLQVSNIFIPNADLRRKMRSRLNACGYSQANTFGLTAVKSVYTKGEAWYLQLKKYLQGNLEFATAFIKERIPGIQVVQPEGTYLLWLDCSGLGLQYKALERLILDDAKLWLDPGVIFGRETALFERLNYACPRSVLKQALLQLEHAVRSRSEH